MWANLGSPRAGRVVRAAYFESRKGGDMQQRWKEEREDKPSSRGRLLWDVEERICDGASERSAQGRAGACPRVCVGGMGGWEDQIS